MKTLFLALTILLSGAGVSQDRGEFWLGAGISKKIIPKTIVSFQSNLRTSYKLGPQTWFQELGIKSEHLDWFHASLDYRFVVNFDELRNAAASNRINLNGTFKYKFGSWKPSLRFRYQFFVGNPQATGTDLDPSFRIKPALTYKIEDSRISPTIGAEFFYDPVYSSTGRRFNRQRYSLGADIDLPGNNELSLAFYYGRKFNTANQFNEFLVSAEYNFELKKKKTKKKAEE